MCLFSICMSFLKIFDPFLIGLFVFLLLSFKSSLYILGNSSLSDMSFANIFFICDFSSHSLDTLSFTEQNFLILMKSSTSIIPFMDSVFDVISTRPPKSSPIPTPRCLAPWFGTGADQRNLDNLFKTKHPEYLYWHSVTPAQCSEFLRVQKFSGVWIKCFLCWSVFFFAVR